MGIQIACPHCAAACLIDPQHLGAAVRCFACARVFVPPKSAGPTSADHDFPLPTFDALPERPAATAALHLDIAAATTRGKIRQRHEDRCLVRRQVWNRAESLEELAFLCIADGMGGNGGGDLAGALTVRAAHQALAPLFDDGLGENWPPPAPELLGQRLRQGLLDASKAVHAAAQRDAAFKGMGAAAVAALLWDSRAHIAHVGDARAYHFRAGVLNQVTKDQTLVQRMLDLGTLAPHEAKHHPARHELTQAIGRRPDVNPALGDVHLVKDEWLLLASDGLHAHLEPAELRREMELALPSAAWLTKRLVDLADERGGTDNCTVIAVYAS
jgi:serine/threonine protein phosphatase PrpC